MSRVVSLLLTPYRKAVTSASSRLAVLGRSEPNLKQYIDACEAEGRDATEPIFREYFQWQNQLWQYRRERLWLEGETLASGKVASMAHLCYKDAFVTLRVLTKMLWLFLVCTLLGRGTVFPLLEPTSPFLEEAALMQPNHKRHLGVPVE